MARVKGGTTSNKRRKNILAMTKGYRFGRSTKKKQAKEAIFHAGKYAFAHRKDKKNDYRRLFTVRINGATYQQFIFPGVIAMSVIASSLFAAIAIVWDREFGFMREMLVAPVSRAVLVGGKAAGGIAVAVTQGFVLVVLAPLVDVHLSVAKVVELLGALLLLAYAMTAIGILLASRMKRLESFQMVMALALQPMVFLSGAIFPLERLPGWFAALCALNPAAYGVDLARRALLGSDFALTIGDHVVPIWADVTILLVVGSALLVAATKILGTVE